MSDTALPLALDLIKRFEGFSIAPYLDTAGKATIGYGSLAMPDGSPVTMASRAITQAEADAMLAAFVVKTLSAVRAMVYVPLTDAQTAALTSFAYNLGTGALRGSTLLRYLNQGNYAEAAAQFGGWVYSGGRVTPGLVNRRAAERAVFAGAMPVPAAAPQPSEADDLNARELARIQGA